MPKPTPLHDDLESIVAESVLALPESGGHVEKAIGFFDLVGSTQRKMDEGHRNGTIAALQHNALCAGVGSRFGGEVVKSLGDGVFMTFASSRDAMLAALNINAGFDRFTDLETKIGLTVGSIERLTVLDQPDFSGAAVDRCARLQAKAAPGEIVVDEPFFRSVETHLGDFDGIILGEWEIDAMKGVGEVRLRRLGIKAAA